MKINYLVVVFLSFALSSHAQGLVQSINQSDSTILGCGSYHFMQNIDAKNPGFIEESDQFLESISDLRKHKTAQSAANNVISIPVVFHVVYNNSEENIPDSVIQNQLTILNQSFRRTTPDTSSMRPAFSNIVGDTKIEFKLADIDPQGNPTTGIVRKQTSVEYFGGILPYSANQTNLIVQWINDTLYQNLFRITRDSLGGSETWDSKRYLNIWMGDLRILEPKVNNFEELLFFGLATPPVGHPIWPALPFDISKNQGVLLHYVNVGANNPVNFPGQYAIYNNLVKGGKILVHEVGHYLGLRHIWGDGLCPEDDFVFDTPKANNSAGFACNKTRNTCVDTINGVDLPDMVENYMDYTSTACQNSFTNGQIALMRDVLNIYRNDFAVSLNENPLAQELSIYPNPSKGKFVLGLEESLDNLRLSAFNLSGLAVPISYEQQGLNVEVKIEATAGLYFILLESDSGQTSFKVVLE